MRRTASCQPAIRRSRSAGAVLVQISSLGLEGASRNVEIGLDELKKLPAFEIAAVCQCAGNRRGFFQPHIAGVQWGNGAIGCARWKGARLKDVLDMVGRLIANRSGSSFSGGSRDGTR